MYKNILCWNNKKTSPSSTKNQKRKQNKVLKDKGGVKGDAKRILSAK